MNILFDHLCFWQRYGGVPRYFIEIMKRISPDNYTCTAKISNNEYLHEIGIRPIPFFPKIKFRGKSRIESEIGKIISLPTIVKGNYDIYHQTHYDPYAYRFLPKNVKTVTTIHDLNFYTIPEFYPVNNRTKRHMEQSVELADHIVTISQNSKQDLIKYLGCREDKISVIYHGIDVDKFAHISNTITIEAPFILYVGARNKYKNFESVVRSFAILRKKFSDLQMFCAGTAPSSSELRLLADNNIINNTVFCQCSDEELVELYNKALLFVFPSYYEGFGLPILEAMAAGCPVVLSNTSCFPEIAGDAGCYFNPYDIDSMVDSLEKVIINTSLREKMIQKGKERIGQFSWSESAAKHLSLYKSIL